MFQLEQKTKTDTSISSQVSPSVLLACVVIVLIDPRTRVALYLQQGVPTSDYINANYIRVRYIYKVCIQCMHIASL